MDAADPAGPTAWVVVPRVADWRARFGSDPKGPPGYPTGEGPCYRCGEAVTYSIRASQELLDGGAALLCLPCSHIELEDDADPELFVTIAAIQEVAAEVARREALN